MNTATKVWTYDQVYKDSDELKNFGTYHHVLVDKDVANSMLAKNNRNREKSDSRVNQYINDMLKGNWKTNGDSIRFDANGNLADGQNRLHAIAKSGKTAYWDIVTGVPVDAFETIDVGKARSTRDIFTIMGFKYPQVMATAARAIMAFSDAKDVAAGGIYTNLQVREFVDDPSHNMALLEEFAGRCAGLNNSKLYTKGVMTAYMYIFAQVDKLEAEEFFSLLDSGVGLLDGDPILVLRNELIKRQSNASHFTDFEKKAKLVKAFNAYHNKRKIAKKDLAYTKGANNFPRLEK